MQQPRSAVNRARRAVIGLSFSCVIAISGIANALPPAAASRPAEAVVDPAHLCGRLEHVDRLPVLYLWGTPQQRGAAQGYLLAADIHAMLTEYLEDEHLSGGPRVYENVTIRLVTSAALQRGPRIDEELRGMIAGVKARLGEKGMRVEALNRPIGIQDLIAVQSASDSPPLGCSSFAAWGHMTKDGRTLAARNLDWFAAKCLVDHRVLVVRAPDPKAGRLGWASLTWPGAIGCYTGMNEEGVTMCIHDVPTGMPRVGLAMMPRPLALREAIELSHASTAFDDIPAVLRRQKIMMATNVPVAAPSSAGGAASAVFEYDGWGGKDAGVTMRRPDSQHEWQICTNHYRC